MSGVDALDDPRLVDIDGDGDAPSGTGDRRPRQEGGLGLRLGATLAHACLEGLAGGDTGILDQAPLLRIEDRRRAAHQPASAEVKPDQQRHAPRPRQDRHMAIGAARQERAAAITLPVDLQEAGGRQIIGDINASLAAAPEPMARRRRRPEAPAPDP